MTIRANLVKCIEAGGSPDEITRRICGMLSCECGLDNGNGWYDDDPEMVNGGLEAAEENWLGRPERNAEIEAAIKALQAKWAEEDGEAP